MFKSTAEDTPLVGPGNWIPTATGPTFDVSSRVKEPLDVLLVENVRNNLDDLCALAQRIGLDGLLDLVQLARAPSGDYDSGRTGLRKRDGGASADTTAGASDEDGPGELLGRAGETTRGRDRVVDLTVSLWRGAGQRRSKADSELVRTVLVKAPAGVGTVVDAIAVMG